jgi:hypothetical protein
MLQAAAVMPLEGGVEAALALGVIVIVYASAVQVVGVDFRRGAPTVRHW